MLDFFKGAATVAAGVLFAAAIVLAGFHMTKPASSVSLDLAAYACQLQGTKLECSRK